MEIDYYEATSLDAKDIIEYLNVIASQTNNLTFGKNEFDPVEVVVACAVFDTHEYVNALLQLMTAIRKPSFLEMMRKAKRPNDVIHFLEGASINIVNKKAIII